MATSESKSFIAVTAARRALKMVDLQISKSEIEVAKNLISDENGEDSRIETPIKEFQKASHRTVEYHCVESDTS